MPSHSPRCFCLAAHVSSTLLRVPVRPVTSPSAACTAELTLASLFWICPHLLHLATVSHLVFLEFCVCPFHDIPHILFLWFVPILATVWLMSNANITLRGSKSLFPSVLALSHGSPSNLAPSHSSPRLRSVFGSHSGTHFVSGNPNLAPFWPIKFSYC